MAETESIQKMAELASQEIFSVFGWEQLPLMNQNWECVEPKKHRKQRKSKTHPSDTVFKYVDPYSGEDTYVNTDLKSYAKTTLDSADLTKTLRDLGHSTECANKSSNWKSLFVNQKRNHLVIGMLFVYNHDGGYDKDFAGELASVAPSQIEFDPTSFVGVVGPERVIYLNSITKDLKALQADGLLPEKHNRWFVFPHLSRSAAVHKASPSAPLGALLSPLIVVGYEFPESAKAPTDASAGQWHRRGLYAYYDGPGESLDEFKYLLDYFFKYQLEDEKTRIVINLVFPHADASAIFALAKKEYARDYWAGSENSKEEFQAVLDNIQLRHVQSVVQKFSQTNLGMIRT